MKTLSLFSLFFVFLQLNAAKPNAAEPNAPYNLRSCDKSNAIGISDKPYFAWFINDPDDNEIQSAYQIIVSSSATELEENKW